MIDNYQSLLQNGTSSALIMALSLICSKQIIGLYTITVCNTFSNCIVPKSLALLGRSSGYSAHIVGRFAGRQRRWDDKNKHKMCRHCLAVHGQMLAVNDHWNKPTLFCWVPAWCFLRFIHSMLSEFNFPVLIHQFIGEWTDDLPRTYRLLHAKYYCWQQYVLFIDLLQCTTVHAPSSTAPRLQILSNVPKVLSHTEHYVKTNYNLTGRTN